MCQKYPSVLIHPIINNSTSPHPGRKSRSFLLGCIHPPFLAVISSTRSCDPCFAVLGSYKGVISTLCTAHPLSVLSSHQLDSLQLCHPSVLVGWPLLLTQLPAEGPLLPHRDPGHSTSAPKGHNILSGNACHSRLGILLSASLP